MVGTRRSNSARTPPQPVSSRKRTKTAAKVTPLQGYRLAPCAGQVSSNLLTTCFERMRAQIWYSILPSDGQNSDISSGTRQSWDHLLPILLRLGLLKKMSKLQQDLTLFCQNGTSLFITCLAQIGYVLYQSGKWEKHPNTMFA